MAGPVRSDDPRSLGDLFDRVRHGPKNTGRRPDFPLGDGFIFSGNRHDAVPRALLLDGRLTPLDRNAWQVFRLLLNDDGITAFPTYDLLAPFLTSMPFAARASHETVARALTVLRLTRWISLPERFTALKMQQQRGVLAALQAVDADLRQPILDEWDIRCSKSAIRNPAGYLFGLVQRAVRGEFTPWAAAPPGAEPRE